MCEEKIEDIEIKEVKIIEIIDVINKTRILFLGVKILFLIFITLIYDFLSI